MTLTGEETELDKMAVEAIADPLMHLIRNAVGHGIEPARERAERGKPPRGAVRLGAYPKGGSVVVTVEDDGAGLDYGKIGEAAARKGLRAENSARPRPWTCCSCPGSPRKTR